MKPKIADLGEALGALQAQDRSYRDKWLDEAFQWQAEGVYSAIASCIDELPEDGLHVDLGSGVGQLAVEIKKQHPGATVVGVERNTHMMTIAVDFAKRMKLQPIVYHGEIVLPSKEGSRVYTEYAPITPDEVNIVEGTSQEGILIRSRALENYYASTFENGFIDDGPTKVHYVIDDIRTLKSLRKLMGERPLDSGSLTFPGGSGRVAFEAPYKAPGIERVTSQAGNSRITNKMLEVVKAGYRFFAEKLKPGGTLVIAERYLKIPDAERLLMSTARQRMGDEVSRCFRPTSMQISKGTVTKNSGDDTVEWALVNQGRSTIINGQTELGLAHIKFVRNDEVLKKK